MRSPRVPILVLSAIALLVLAGHASAAAFSDRASLSHGGRIGAGQSITAKVNVHEPFSTVDSVCFFFTFEDDLLDPGDWIQVTFDVGNFGQENGFEDPVSTVGVCLGDDPAMKAQFLDGRETFTLSMNVGTVKLAKLDVVVDGVPS